MNNSIKCCDNREFDMKNRVAFIGLSLSILLALAIIGFEIYINGRPENFDYCNIGDYPYSNWYYEYGDFVWRNVVWGKIFGSAKLYIELLLLIPYFICSISKIKGQPNGSYRSIWLKIIMAISSVPLIIVLLSLLEHSQPIVTDYDTERDPAARAIFKLFLLTTIGYYLNMFCWIMVYLVKKICSAIKK
jgi:hypothetical protein